MKTHDSSALNVLRRKRKSMMRWQGRHYRQLSTFSSHAYNNNKEDKLGHRSQCK